MTIPAIDAISSSSGVSGLSGLSGLGATTDSSATGSASATSGSDFASMLSKGIGAVSDAQNKADTLAVQAATGDLTNIHDYTIAATQASLMTELASAIRTKGVDAFNQIMGMQA
ncbi:flagellar hook-basal body complex protein FliE [Jatrophihabitans telluris]|uniref:Flagellar hook-basal body complex protein FliE n=1 Tax=Jatrophihabitans telluris TaxID=2038343 RepID=A0ABY4QWP1_9ACTN|nr:flagellar hook-basal body complex protein FliE [Jatrophihabitans telluris]UQX87950.1 flagellar hook-basal body complex protein FliE [Jatrophihabitans telluris]